ncbi:DUF3096 domain-containing protein [Candidatus Pacearchaeota archaeon CG10_big_fil_rev_8_21_14_0_10_32_14]|nr:MAG: DUF3096 domain-containing protein [Candidatus Pacearchaeota archaeon CG10_big_fil_rev_8_21_14_0_10_32_14]
MVAIVLNIIAILAIIVGILILAFPRFLRYSIGLFLIISGILGLLSANNLLLSPYF